MAEELLWYMDKSYRTGIHPNARPDARGFTHVIRALARSGEPGSAVKAEKLLEYMKERYYIHNESHLKPDRKVYNSVIHQHNDESLSPDLITFNSLLNAWALSGTRCCGYKAESYLEQMWKLYNAGDNELVKPNDLSYNTVRVSGIHPRAAYRLERPPPRGGMTFRRKGIIR